MIIFTTINILGQSNFILNLKKGYDKTLKNISTVSEDWLKISTLSIVFYSVVSVQNN